MRPRYMVSEPVFQPVATPADRRARLNKLKEQLAKIMAEIETLIDTDESKKGR